MPPPRSKTVDDAQESNAEDQLGKKSKGNSASRGRARGRGGKSNNSDSAPRSALASITGPANNARQAAAADSLGSEYERTLEQRLEDLQNALAEAQAAQQQAEVNAAAAAAVAAAAAAAASRASTQTDNSHNQEVVVSIPKPRGSAGDGYCLIDEMGLVEDKLTYNAIVATVHELSYGAGLDWNCTYSRQNKEKLVRIFEVARKRHPYLKRFKNNWATNALCHQYFKNHCRQIIKVKEHTARTSYASAAPEDLPSEGQLS